MSSHSGLAQFSSRFLLSASILLPLSLIGCGGGSGGSSVSTYTVGGTVSGLTGSGLVLQNNNSDDLSVAGVSFKFSTALDDGSSYDVTVLAQPSGRSCVVGNGSGTLAGANVTDVAVTCRGWGSAELIESDDTNNAAYPDIAVDRNGNAVVVWRQDDGSVSSIYANLYVAGTGWGTPELIETNNDGSAYSPRIAFDADGNAIAVWQQSDSIRPNIWVNRYVTGSGWGTAELIESDNTGSAFGPLVVVDDSGNAIAVWYQFDGSYYSIWSNHYEAGTGWGTADVIESDDTGNAYNPRIALDGDGNALAVWRHNDGSRFNIVANRYVVGAGWGTAELIESDNSGTASSPDIATDSSGNALAVWMQDDGTVAGGTHYNVWSNRYVVGAGWGTPELIESVDTIDATYPRIAFDDSDNALAVWIQWDETADLQSLWANRYVAGSGWGSAEEVDSSADYGYSQQLAFDGDGNALVVWYVETGGLNSIMANRYIADVGWGSAELIESDDSGRADDPKIVIDGDGNGIAVWQQNDASDITHIWVSRFE